MEEIDNKAIKSIKHSFSSLGLGLLSNVIGATFKIGGISVVAQKAFNGSTNYEDYLVPGFAYVTGEFFSYVSRVCSNVAIRDEVEECILGLEKSGYIGNRYG